MNDQQASTAIATLMSDFRKGDKTAANRLIELLYPELRKLAAARMRGERKDHSWQPTVLVNELYLTLVKARSLGSGDGAGDQEKAAFLGLAGQIMKRLLIDHSRPLYRKAIRAEFVELAAPHGVDSLTVVEDTLTRLATIDPKLRAVVEMRVFEGLTGAEIAQQLDVSPRTVANYWTFGKRWLQTELATDDQAD